MQKYQNNIQDQLGNAINSVTVTVRTNPGGALATIYSDNGVTGKSNPFTNDSDGEFFFYAASGRYDVILSGPVSETKSDILLQDFPGGVSSFSILADIVTATPPTTEAVTAQLEYYDLDSTDLLAQVGYNGSNTFRLANRMHGGLVQLNGENAAGTAVNMVSASPDGDAHLYYAGALKVSAVSNGVNVRSAGNTDAETRIVDLLHLDGTRRGYLGHAGGTALNLFNAIHGGPVVISAEDAGGTNRNLFNADPDGTTTIYNAGTGRIQALPSGIAAVLSDASTDTEVRALNFSHADGTVRAEIGHKNSNDILFITNNIHGARLVVSSEDSGGTERNFLDGDPDGVTILRGDTDVDIQVAVGETAIYATANAGVGVYYNDQENFRTSDESAADIGMGAEVRHNDDAFYPVGMNVAPEKAQLDSGNLTLGQGQVGGMLTYNSATARSLFFNNDSAIKVGALWALKVGPSAGTLTGDGGTGVQIRWWNGAGWTTTAAAGNITIGVGSYTIWKETDTLYWIDGPTLS